MAIYTTGNSVGLTAQEHRNQTAVTLPSFKTALGVRGGVHSGLGIKKTSGMGFSIDPGRVVVEPSSPSFGPYVVTLDAAQSLTFEPGDSTRGRIDIVAVKVDETAGVESPGQLTIIKGAYPSNGAAVAPTVPLAHEALWQVPIPAGMSAGSGGWVLANAKDLRRNLVANGAAIPVNSLSERNALAAYEGMQVMRLDLNGTVDRYIDGKWRGNTEWINCNYNPYWNHVVPVTQMKVKLTANGMLGMISGEVRYTGPTAIQEGLIIGSIPPAAMEAGITPAANCWVIGTDDTYKGLVIIQITDRGEVKLGPAPTGKVFMFQGTFPIEMK